MIIAIDGPAASGKGTLGKRLAKHYGYRHLREKAHSASGSPSITAIATSIPA